MDSLKAVSEGYVRSFRSYLWLYPKSYRAKYGEEMVSLLRDQLADAERLGDRHVMKEIYLHALAGLPASIIKERWSATVNGERPTLGVFPGLGWQLALLPLAVIYVISVFAGAGSSIQGIGAVCGVAYLLAQAILVFQVTRRLLLSAITLIFSLVGWWLANFIASVGYGYYADPTSKYYRTSEALQALLPILLALGLSLVFYWLRHKLRRPDLTLMNDAELAQYRQRLERMRKRRSAIVGTVLLAVVIANVAGLNDPAHDDSDLNLPVVKVASADNMYSDLKSLGQPQLTDRQKVAIFLQAAQKKVFQEPAFADMSQYQTVEAAANAPLLNYNPVGDTARAIVNHAVNLRANNQAELALTNVLAVIKVGDAISASQGPIITNMIGRSDELNAIDYLLSWQQNDGFTPTEQSMINVVLSGLQPQSEGIVKALKTEYQVEGLGVSSLRSPATSETGSIVLGSYFISRAAYVPYFYQPNRTKAIFTNRFRTQMTEATKPCAQQSLGVSFPAARNPVRVALDLMSFNGLGKLMGETAWTGNFWQPESCQLEAKINQLKTTK